MTDEEFCISILPRVSRTFALSIEALPESLRATLRAAYLLCRVVDTIEDDPHLPQDQRESLFSEFTRIVSDDDSSPQEFERAFEERRESDDHELCRHFGAPIRAFRSVPVELRTAARPHILEMAGGMTAYSRRWQGPNHLTVLEDQDDLEHYCYFVAGTVGNMLTRVFVASHKGLEEEVINGLRQRSVSFGLGLQLTNIVKDVATDHERGWCFLPATFCALHGVDPERLLDPDCRSEAMEVVRDVVSLARKRLDDALEYTILLPHDARAVRLFVLVPLALAQASLTLVERCPAVLVPGKTVKISRTFVADVLSRASEVLDDDDGIRTLCSQAVTLKL